MSGFGYVNNEFINLYSDENPILGQSEYCYFLITNNNDYHRPLICKGLIVGDKFTDGMNKIYYIMCTDILESPNIINDFFIGKTFQTVIYDYEKDFIKSGKNMIFNYNSEILFRENLFPVEAFFVRKSLEKISVLRKEYISIIRRDLFKQISDIESI